MCCIQHRLDEACHRYRVRAHLALARDNCQLPLWAAPVELSWQMSGTLAASASAVGLPLLPELALWQQRWCKKCLTTLSRQCGVNTDSFNTPSESDLHVALRVPWNLPLQWGVPWRSALRIRFGCYNSNAKLVEIRHYPIQGVILIPFFSIQITPLVQSSGPLM